MGEAPRTSLDSSKSQQHRLQWSVPQTGLLPPWGKPYTLPQTHSPVYQSTPILPVSVSQAYSTHLNPSFQHTPAQPPKAPPPQHQPAMEKARLPSQHAHTSFSTPAHPAYQQQQQQASTTVPSTVSTDSAYAPMQQAASAVPTDHMPVHMQRGPVGDQAAAAGSQDARSISPASPVSLTEDTCILQTGQPGSHAPMQSPAPASRSLESQVGCCISKRAEHVCPACTALSRHQSPQKEIQIGVGRVKLAALPSTWIASRSERVLS